MRLLIGSRHMVLRSGCRCLLEKRPLLEVVEECAASAEVLEAYPRVRPDAAVLDVELDGADGIETARLLVAIARDVRVLVLGAWDDPWSAVRALEAGALGFVWRYADTAILLQAVQSVAANKPFLTKEISEQVALLRVNLATDPFSGLSRREFEIFRLIAAGKPLHDVAVALSLSPRSVANYQSHIRGKLNVSNNAELVHLALRHGVIHVQV